jgi:membrane protein
MALAGPGNGLAAPNAMRMAPPRRWFGLGAAHLRRASHPILSNILDDRCTHLAAMIAYYALLSMIPFLFLVLSVIGWVGQPSESSFLIEQMQRVLPGQPVGDLVELVERLRANAGAYGLIGLIGIVWTSLGLLSAVESALNIIYEVPNRPFLRQKLVVTALVGSSIVGLFMALLVVTTVVAWIAPKGSARGLDLLAAGVSLVFTAALSFGLLYTAYRRLPNTRLTSREVLPGAIFTTVAFQGSFQLLPVYLDFGESLPTLEAFGGIVLLLVWLYVLCNVFLLGAEINWWYGRGRHADAEPGLGLA